MVKAIYRESYAIPFTEETKESVQKAIYEICEELAAKGMNTEIVFGMDIMRVSGCTYKEIDDA